MLLSQQASLLRLDGQRAVVRVSGKWIAMVQSRLPLLETALLQALGSPRQVLLEASEQSGSSPVAAAVVSPPLVPVPVPVVPVVPVEPVVPAPPVPTPPPGPTPAAEPPRTGEPGERSERQPLDDQARRLADFFNGEVVSLEE